MTIEKRNCYAEYWQVTPQPSNGREVVEESFGESGTH